MNPEELEGAADDLLRRFWPNERMSLRKMAEAVLGPGAVRRVPSSALPSGMRGCLATVKGQPIIHLRSGLDPKTERFVLGHEIGEWILRSINYTDQDIEQAADYLGACLVVPRRALQSLRRELGDDLRALADAFIASETCVALRLGEAGCAQVTAVVSPHVVRVRSLYNLTVPEPYLRRVARTGAPGVRRVRLTDDRKRTALLKDED